MAPKYAAVGSRAYPVAISSFAPAPEPCVVLQPSAAAKSGCGDQPAAPTLVELDQAFLRQSAQVRAYRAKRDQELDEVGDD